MEALLSPEALKVCVEEKRKYTPAHLWLHVIGTAVIIKAMGERGTRARRVLGKERKAARCSLGLRKWASVTRHATV